jgi:hypothetical protein
VRRLKAASLLAALLIAAVIWIPLVHVFFSPSKQDMPSQAGVSERARQLEAAQREAWNRDGDGEIARMRRTNAEWDFMSRTFLVLALANMALREPKVDRSARLQAIDRLIEDTLEIERTRGMYAFLMPYARGGQFIAKPARSLFIDGEIALMIAARNMVERSPRYASDLRVRVDSMIAQMSQSPILCGESYPDECWIFCNSVAIAAIRMFDVVEGADHHAFIAAWLERTKRALIDPATGLLISSYDVRGKVKDGPEGSSVWIAAHCLLLVDEELARDQYRRAQDALARTVVGFGYAREWPTARPGRPDVDSGPIVPFLEASAGSSGLALVAASAFGDECYLGALMTTLDLAAFPTRDGSKLRYLASNRVGDAVLLYALVEGPLWRKVRAGRS